MTSAHEQLSARRRGDGPEVAAELPLADLIAALPALLPSGWVCGVDDVTPNTAFVFARPRERCASIEIDVGGGDFSLTDLEAGARLLSGRHGARVVLWGDGAEIFFVELQAGEPIARLGRGQAGDHRGVAWRSLVAGAIAPPFPVELLAPLAAGRDAAFVEGLRCWQHGARRARGEPVAQLFRRYVTRAPSPALRAVMRAALRRARATGSALLKGLGRVLWRAPDGVGGVAVRPARSLLRFFGGGGAPPGIDFSSLTTRLGAAAVAQAERDLSEALAAARESRCDVVFPGLLCITTRWTPPLTSKNPRDGSSLTLPGHLSPSFIFDEGGPAAPRLAAASIQSTPA